MRRTSWTRRTPAPSSGPDGILVDIGRASEVLHEVLSGLTYRNLDDEPELAGANSTTEVLAKVVADRLAARVDELGGGPQRLLVTLHESHVAWAGYERSL